MASYDSVDLIKKMLPRIYAQRKHVALEIFVARTHYNYLVPMMDEYVFKDGTVKDLMSLRGTIPALYRGKTYNIPVCIWLEESYPASAPICYVNPTREMMIVKGKHTNSNGQVQLPYLQEWRQTECDLVSLLQVMAAMFGESPPVCIRPNPGPEQASCSRQFHNQADGHQETAPHLSLTREDGLPFPQENETNC